VIESLPVREGTQSKRRELSPAKRRKVRGKRSQLYGGSGSRGLGWYMSKEDGEPREGAG